ncbi:ribonuclease H-like protein [Mycena olivaceomarginata]|nr:ribonuclease H-like protein [Mycena olivaceomarginata]
MNPDGDLIAGAGIWFSATDKRNAPLQFTENVSSDDSATLSAVLHVLQNVLPVNVCITFKLSSRRIIQNLTVDLNNLEASLWAEKSNIELYEAIVAVLRIRGDKCSFCQVAGPDDINAIREAKSLAEDGLNHLFPEDVETDILDQYRVQGIQLASASQASLYKAIRKSKPRPERIQTTIMLDMTRFAVQELTGKLPTDEEIWFSIRDKDITNTIRDFLWKCLHQGYKCGTHWRNIPGYEQWATCTSCQVDDTMEHILLECNAPGQSVIWKVCKDLWLKKHPHFPILKIGTILGCSLAEFKNSKGKLDREASRLFRILVTESAYLVWSLRCERVISRGNDPSKYHSEIEIHNRWLSRINYRLKMDQLLTDIGRYGNRATKVDRVLRTWDGILMDNENLPGNWIWQSGVLVGIGSLRPPGRNR